MAPFHTVALKHVTLSDSEGSLPTKFETLPGTDPPGQVLVAANAPSHRPEGGTCTVRKYGVSLRESDIVILNQEKHHAKQSCKDEYLDFLKKFEIEHDVRYLFEWLE